MLGGPIHYPDLSVLNALAIKMIPGRAKFQFTSIKPTFSVSVVLKCLRFLEAILGVFCEVVCSAKVVVAAKNDGIEFLSMKKLPTEQ